MKKKHPCGADIFTVTRIGMDFKLVCDGCGHEVIVPRSKAEKAIKKIVAYEKNGIFPGEDLILTYETRTSPIEQKVIMLLIQRYLK